LGGRKARRSCRERAPWQFSKGSGELKEEKRVPDDGKKAGKGGEKTLTKNSKMEENAGTSRDKTPSDQKTFRTGGVVGVKEHLQPGKRKESNEKENKRQVHNSLTHPNY